MECQNGFCRYEATVEYVDTSANVSFHLCETCGAAFLMGQRFPNAVDEETCYECGEPFTDDEWEDRHQDDEHDYHARCCPNCLLHKERTYYDR